MCDSSLTNEFTLVRVSIMLTSGIVLDNMIFSDAELIVIILISLVAGVYFCSL